MGGYELDTGKELWRMSGGGDCPTPTPIAGQGLIFLTSAHGPRKPIYAVRVEAAGDVSLAKGTVTNQYVAWSSPKGGSYMQTPLLCGDYLYSCENGALSCYQSKTGALQYKETLGGNTQGFSASPVASNGNLYFTSERGDVFVVKAGPQFSALATNHLGEVCMATPAISEGTLYIRTQTRVIAISDGY